MTFASLFRFEPRALGFGLLHALAATVGQTFVISLFLPAIKTSFALDDAQVSLLFTLTTLASAAAIWRIGSWMDRIDLIRYCLACGVLLAFSCVAIAAARDVMLLATGMFCLRLTGNGLLTHIALTATTRYFVRERGRALSIVMLGSPLGEVALPLVLVSSVAAHGWRPTLAAAGCIGLLLVSVAAMTVRKEALFRSPARAIEDTPAPPQHATGRVYRDQRAFFALAAPLILLMPLVITATVFHQALIAEEKGVSLQWFAASFVLFAVSRTVTSLQIGVLADRKGSDWLFSVHLLPLAIGTVALVIVDSAWVVPLYWFCAGVTSGMGGVLQSTVIAERVSPARLGTARSVVAAGAILASATGPLLYGVSLAAGASIPMILWISVAALITATATALWSAARSNNRQPPTATV